MKLLARLRPSPAMVVSCIALGVALGGTSVAAINALPRNSVGTKQLKNGAVTKKKINKKTIAQLRGNRGPRGLQGLQGAQGAQGAQGIQGIQGPPGPFPDPLPSGRTLRGHFGLEDYAAAGAQLISTHSFVFTLASAPTGVLVPLSGPNPDPTHCAGSVASPTAAPGYLCVYERQRGSATPSLFQVNRYGFEYVLDATGVGTTFTYSLGTWAVTAP